jgi:hypothetical protein
MSMRLVVALAVVAAAVTAPAFAVAPATKLTISTAFEGGLSPNTYTLTCGPPGIRGLPRGRLKPADACAAVGLAGERLYRPRLSRRIAGCNYVVAPRRATITGYRLGRRVRTVLEVGGCERQVVPLRVLERFVVWYAP